MIEEIDNQPPVFTMDKAIICTAGDLLRLASAGFSYPETETIELVRDYATSILESSSSDPYVRQVLQSILQQLDVERRRHIYMEIFLRGGVAVTESHSTGRLDSVADVCAFYAAFGVNPRKGETPDSLMHELEFASVLCAMIVHAPSSENLSVTADALWKFLEGHLIPFTQSMSKKLEQFEESGYYQDLMKIVQYAIDRLIIPEIESKIAEGKTNP